MAKRQKTMGIKEKIERWSDIAVSGYVNDNKDMDQIIAKAALQEGLNDQQIARVVQAANKKVFIKLFPQKHEFDVASEEGVKKMLNKQTGVEKKASVSTPAGESRGRLLNYNVLHQVKPEEVPAVKSASASSIKGLIILRDQVKRAKEELQYQGRQKQAELAKIQGDLVIMAKQAMLRGATFGDLETYALSLPATSSEKVARVIDSVYEKIENTKLISKKAFCRGERVESFVGKPNSFTESIDSMIKISHEDIPIIHKSLGLLESKYAEVSRIVDDSYDN